MPANFDFFSVPRIVFGRGQFARLAELAAPLGRTALVVANGPAELFDRLTAHLAAAGIRHVAHLQKGEPTVQNIDAALAVGRNASCTLVIGLGGGSAIDAAKAAAGLLANGGTALDYMEVVGKGQKITRPALPWIAIPTTAGTGAEATRNAVIGYKPDGGGGAQASGQASFKASLRSELLLPRIALIDPELGVSVPPAVTASSGMDALCQCIEAYTSTGATPMTNPVALEGVRRAARSLKRAYTNGQDLDAREDMALAALFSGIALTNAGLGAVHGFAAPLGASFPVPHGVVCAALLPHVMRANVLALRAANSPTLARYTAVSCAMLQRDLPDAAAIDAAIAFIESLARDLRIPRLSQFGFTPAAVPAQVALAQKSNSMRYNPIPLTPETLAQILTAAL
jgi:alcohol dehydrogenase class IV